MVTVVGASFDEDAPLWRLETGAGETINARFVVAPPACSPAEAAGHPRARGFSGTVMRTATYAELAAKVPTPCGSRNRVWRQPDRLVIPCHRIVRTDGDVGNYGGGSERKEWLLAHERRHSR